MILKMYAIKDELNGFSALVPFMSDDIAKRYMRDQTIENPIIKNTPSDFSIWSIGEFDTDTGEFTQKEKPTLIERAK